MAIVAIVLIISVWVRLTHKPPPTSATGSTVSRNRQARLNPHKGPSWEQDAPYPECFQQEDDL